MGKQLKILITGCSSGIGFELAQVLVQRGHRVYGTVRRQQDMARLAALGIQPYILDVTDEKAVGDWIGNMTANETIHMLVNNAGFAVMGPVLALAAADLQRQWQTNITGAVNVANAVAQAMIQRGKGGRIVQIGSVSGHLTTPFAGAYCASKAALHALSDAMRLELAPFDIEVVRIEPGAVRSRFADNAAAAVPNIGDASPFAPIRHAVAARVRASQDKPMDTHAFAIWLADKITAPKVPAVLRNGRGARALPFMARWLPRSWRERILSRRFHLHKLKQLVNSATARADR